MENIENVLPVCAYCHDTGKIFHAKQCDCSACGYDPLSAWCYCECTYPKKDDLKEIKAEIKAALLHVVALDTAYWELGSQGGKAWDELCKAALDAREAIAKMRELGLLHGSLPLSSWYTCVHVDLLPLLD